MSGGPARPTAAALPRPPSGELPQRAGSPRPPQPRRARTQRSSRPPGSPQPGTARHTAPAAPEGADRVCPAGPGTHRPRGARPAELLPPHHAHPPRRRRRSNLPPDNGRGRPAPGPSSAPRDSGRAGSWESCRAASGAADGSANPLEFSHDRQCQK